MFHSGGCFLRAFIPILAMFLAVGSTHAGIVASFQADYVAGTTAGQTRAERSADGWNYMTNTAGALGTASNYTSLLWNPTAVLDGKTGGYTITSGTYPTPTTDIYTGLFANGVGHVGKGSTQPASGGINRYAIAAYTIQTGEAGALSLNNGVVTTTASTTYPLNVQVYVNNDLKQNYSGVNSSATLNFSGSLGSLIAGDTVYVAVGPTTADFGGHFNLNFEIASVPEPGTLVLFTVGTITCALGALRKRRKTTEQCEQTIPSGE
jgi:hypothetical protein